MKTTFGLWGLIFAILFFTTGFFPAVGIMVLVIGSSVSMGLHAQELGSGSSYKSLR